jgi:prepilin-type N-terminal cleavage/methylation domain-containing protein
MTGRAIASPLWRGLETAPQGEGRRRGFTLLETLVVMFALGVVMLLGTATLLGTMQMAHATTAGFDQLLQRSALADAFRADVAQAVDAPAKVDEMMAGSACLILRKPDGKHIIYRWSNHELERSERSGSGTMRRRLPLAGAGTTVEFTRAGNDQRLIILRLRQLRGSGKRQRQLEIASALGGDLR